MKYFRYVSCVMLVGTSLQMATAADVPPYAVLAEKQEIVLQIKDEPASLDPSKIVGLTEAPVVRDLFEGLVSQDANGKIIPGVAEKWHTTDNQTYIFTLRKNARWSNSDPVTAEDFVYSWRRLVDPKTLSPFAWYAQLAGFNNAEQIIVDQAPITPIYQQTNGRLIKPWVKGYPITNPEDMAYSQTMYILKH